MFFYHSVKEDLLAANTPFSDVYRLSTSGRFTILAIDHGDVLRHHFALEGVEMTDSRLKEAKLAVVRSLAPHCSAVLVDLELAEEPEFVDLKAGAGFGLLVSVDEADYDVVHQPLPSVPDSDQIERAKRAGAAALKVVVYYDRDSVDADARRERIGAIAEMGRRAGLPLLVEPLPTGRVDEASWPVELVARDMADAGAAIVKVPLPNQSAIETRELAERITELLGTVPWIILSSGAAFPEFLERLRGAMAGGASGFAAGRSLWDDLITRPDDHDATSDALRRLNLVIEATIGESPLATPGATTD